MNYYNEYDPKAAAWLRELIRAGEIPPGDVDTRSITEISPNDITGYTQHHFFAGIGGWSLALRLAGVPPSTRLFTGSCPCQPFSVAGKQLGTSDIRHLWPVFFNLIAECGPPIVFGEQVASADGRKWLAGVRADLEGVGYAVGAADLCAAGVSAPHLRQRLYFVANPNGWNASEEWLQRGWQQRQQPEDGRDPKALGVVACESLCGSGQPWEPSITVECEDGQRRIAPGILALADGLPGRLGLLRGYGNAIVPQVAAHFVTAYLEATNQAPNK